MPNVNSKMVTHIAIGAALGILVYVVILKKRGS